MHTSNRGLKVAAICAVMLIVLGLGLWWNSTQAPGASTEAALPDERLALRGVTSAPGEAGVKGISEAQAGRGVYGLATETPTPVPTYGVVGESLSNNGVGVFGRVSNVSGRTVGGDFVSLSGSGRGVRATAANPGATGAAVGGEFETRADSGRGVVAKATAVSGATVGVLAHVASRQGYGVWSHGNLHVTGNASVSGVLIHRIDHPVEAEEKYLQHFALSGPEPQNVYNGIATLDGEGRAWVELPAHFNLINRDPRYQLTALGAAAMLFVSREIDSESSEPGFEIAGGTAGHRVSWEIKAHRADPYVLASPAALEPMKSETERGRFLHPELWGQNPDRGINLP